MVNSDFISIICRRTATKIFFKIYSLYLVRCEASLSLMLSQLQMRTIQKQPNKNRWKISGVCVWTWAEPQVDEGVRWLNSVHTQTFPIHPPTRLSDWEHGTASKFNSIIFWCLLVAISFTASANLVWHISYAQKKTIWSKFKTWVQQ